MKRKKKKNIRRKKAPLRRQLSAAELERLECEYAQACRFMHEGLLHEAAEAYKRVLRINPRHSQSINMLAVIALEDGQPEEAERFARMAIGINPENPGYYNNLGLALQDLVKIEEAAAAFQQALQIRSDFVDALLNLGNAFKFQGNLEKAIGAYKNALSLQPDDPDILNNLGNASRDQENIPAAIEYYQRSIEVNPLGIEALSNIARLFFQANRLAEARQTVNEILKLDRSAQTKLFLATIEYREGNYSNAKKVLSEVIFQDLLGDDQQEAQFLIANIERKLGNYEAAFKMFSRANQGILEQEKKEIQKRQHQNQYFSSDPRPLLSWFSGESVASWERYSRDDGLPQPVFLLGFARSGTTLLDQMLHSHSTILTLEEKNTLVDIKEEFCCPQGKDSFAQLKKERIADYRKGYWRVVINYLGLQNFPKDKVIVDRNPFNASYLGFICRFFPDAKIIVALRDPRDVCLSCFMQNFGMNNITCNFLTMESTVRYYAATMDMLLHFREILPLDFHYVHYENLIEDFEKEARALIAFLGLSWEDKIIQYYETAKKRYIKTASHHQVVKPLYKSAAGRWKNYENFLEPILPILEPYVKIFEAELKKNR